MRGAGRPAAAFVSARRDVLADRALVGHPEDRARRELTADAQHDGAERGQEDGRRRDVGDVHRAVHAEGVVLDVDLAGPGERRVQHLEVAPQQLRRLLVRQAELALDDPVVRDAEAEREASLAHRLVRGRFLRHRDRMARLDRQDGGAELDPLRRAPEQRDHREGVEVARDLRHPDRGEPALLCRLGVGDQRRDLGPVPAQLRADHQADPHGGTVAPPGRPGNLILVLGELGFRAPATDVSTSSPRKGVAPWPRRKISRVGDSERSRGA